MYVVSFIFRIFVLKSSLKKDILSFYDHFHTYCIYPMLHYKQKVYKGMKFIEC